ncbi:hypothetical protein MKZ38_008729 [Zalerion maritima]|uniref:Uncharacterized protein n=1 Tax=Zalerion maritima TaxID=339359 RepID=A0AAD5WMC5_9PEZI|nr:hypothetical protein MKZ38_008729 [Zalerion maritima]
MLLGDVDQYQKFVRLMIDLYRGYDEMYPRAIHIGSFRIYIKHSTNPETPTLIMGDIVKPVWEFVHYVAFEGIIREDDWVKLEFMK